MQLNQSILQKATLSESSTMHPFRLALPFLLFLVLAHGAMFPLAVAQELDEEITFTDVTAPFDDAPALDIHFVPTPTEAVSAMLEMADVGPDDVVFDLGCGDGRIVIAAVKERDAKRGVGVDLDPLRIVESNENANAEGITDRVKFFEQNLFDTDLSEATVVALYLLSSINERLRPKLFDELDPGSRVVSHAFSMGDWEADENRSVPVDGDSSSVEVYYWMIPANASGEWTFESNELGELNGLEIALVQNYQKLTAPVSPEVIDGIQDPRFIAGKMTGNELELILQPHANNIAQVTLTGSLQGDVLEGVFVKGSQEGKWMARRTEGTQSSVLPERRAAQPEVLFPASRQQELH